MEKIHKILILAALNVILVAIPFVFPCVHFTLDNDLMQFFSSGVYTGTPSEYTIYTNIVHGFLLKYLYGINGSVAWYSVYEYFGNMICANIFILSLLSCKVRNLFFILVFLLVFIICFTIAIQPDYTTIAGELGLASIVLIIKFYQVQDKKFLFGSYTLFFMGAILRTQAVVIPYCVFLPLLIFFWMKIKKEFACYYFLLLFTLVFLFAVNKYYYNRVQNWKKYCEYNALRMKINDNPSAENCIKLYPTLIEKDELRLLNEYRVNDGNILDSKKLKISTNYLSHRYFDNIKTNTKPYYYTYAYMLRLIFGFVLFSFVIMLMLKRKVGAFLVFASFAMFLLANLYTMSISRPKEPVILILSISIIACCCILIYNKITSKIGYIVMSCLLSGGYI